MSAVSTPVVAWDESGNMLGASALLFSPTDRQTDHWRQRGSEKKERQVPTRVCRRGHMTKQPIGTQSSVPNLNVQAVTEKLRSGRCACDRQACFTFSTNSLPDAVVLCACPACRRKPKPSAVVFFVRMQNGHFVTSGAKARSEDKYLPTTDEDEKSKQERLWDWKCRACGATVMISMQKEMFGVAQGSFAHGTHLTEGEELVDYFTTSKTLEPGCAAWFGKIKAKELEREVMEHSPKALHPGSQTARSAREEVKHGDAESNTPPRLSPRKIHQQMLEEHRQSQSALQQELSQSSLRLQKSSSSSIRSWNGVPRLSTSAAQRISRERLAYMRPARPYSDMVDDCFHHQITPQVSGAWTDRSHHKSQPVTATEFSNWRLGATLSQGSTTSRPNTHQSRRLMDWEVKVNVRRETGSYYWFSSPACAAISPRIVFGEQSRYCGTVSREQSQLRVMKRGKNHQLPALQIEVPESEGGRSGAEKGDGEKWAQEMETRAQIGAYDLKSILSEDAAHSNPEELDPSERAPVVENHFPVPKLNLSITLDCKHSGTPGLSHSEQANSEQYERGPEAAGDETETTSDASSEYDGHITAFAECRDKAKEIFQKAAKESGMVIGANGQLVPKEEFAKYSKPLKYQLQDPPAGSPLGSRSPVQLRSPVRAKREVGEQFVPVKIATKWKRKALRKCEFVVVGGQDAAGTDVVKRGMQLRRKASFIIHEMEVKHYGVELETTPEDEMHNIHTMWRDTPWSSDFDPNAMYGSGNPVDIGLS